MWQGRDVGDRCVRGPVRVRLKVRREKVVARVSGPGIPAGWTGLEVLSCCPNGGRLAWVIGHIVSSLDLTLYLHHSTMLVRW